MNEFIENDSILLLSNRAQPISNEMIKEVVGQCLVLVQLSFLHTQIKEDNVGG